MYINVHLLLDYIYIYIYIYINVNVHKCTNVHNLNVYAKKEGRTIILTVLLLLPPAPCPGDALFHCESESTLFGLPKKDTTRNQCLSCIYNTVQEEFNPKIRVCALCSAFYGGLFSEPGRVMLAYNAGLHKGCFYKVGQFQIWKDSLTFLTQTL